MVDFHCDISKKCYVKVLDNIPVCVILTTFPLKDFWWPVFTFKRLEFISIHNRNDREAQWTATVLFSLIIVGAKKEMWLAYLWLTKWRLSVISVEAHGKNDEFFRNHLLRNGGATYTEFWVSKLCFIFLYSLMKLFIKFLFTITSLDAQS